MNARYLIALPGLFLALAAAGQTPASKETVVQIHSPLTPLPDRWALAKAEAKRRDYDGGYWIGYSIVKLMEERSFIGSFYSDRRRNRPTLGELLTGIQKEADIPDYDLGENTTVTGSVEFRESERTPRKVEKEVALLFHAGAYAGETDEVRLSNLSLHVDFENDPLIWVGSASDAESDAFLEAAYAGAAGAEVKKNLMMALGVRGDSKRAFEFLTKILRGTEPADIRQEAAFWLGQTGNNEVLGILKEAALTDRSEDVQEKAIFAISQLPGEAGADALISIAKTHRNGETRKQAVFWLGQIASEKAVGVLKEMAYGDDDTDMQRNALFALTQIIEDGGGVDELVAIAKGHPNPAIRKEAIYLLGQSDDPKAFEALVEIVKK